MSGLAFAGSTVIGMAQLYTSGFHEQKNTPTPKAASKDPQLKERERGYELVLQREPDNQVALQGLVETRLQMNNLQGTLEPMEKLVKLNPDNPQYKALLTAIKQRIGKGK